MSEFKGLERYAARREGKDVYIEERREELRSILQDMYSFLKSYQALPLLNLNEPYEMMSQPSAKEQEEAKNVVELRLYIERVLECGGFVFEPLKKGIREYQTTEYTVRSAATEMDFANIAVNAFRLVPVGDAKLSSFAERLSQFSTSINPSWEDDPKH
jgi:hypothetical protein